MDHQHILKCSARHRGKPRDPRLQPDSFPLQEGPPVASYNRPTGKLDLDAELAALPEMTGAELRARWLRLTDRPLPKVKLMLLRHALAFELQAAVYGGLSRRTQRRLAQMAAAAAQGTDRSDMRLVREWQGVLHTVTIDAYGAIEWNGREWNSLSEVARAITGTRWSGPAFFGLKEKGAAA